MYWFHTKLPPSHFATKLRLWLFVIQDAYNGISNLMDSKPKIRDFFRIFRFEINLDQINVKNCKAGKTNGFNKFCSRSKFCNGTLRF